MCLSRQQSSDEDEYGDSKELLDERYNEAKLIQRLQDAGDPSAKIRYVSCLVCLCVCLSVTFIVFLCECNHHMLTYP